jgi:hypothetical protein
VSARSTNKAITRTHTPVRIVLSKMPDVSKEYLNTMAIPGISLHETTPKLNFPILLHNLNSHEGLCSGTQIRSSRPKDSVFPSTKCQSLGRVGVYLNNPISLTVNYMSHHDAAPTAKSLIFYYLQLRIEGRRF